MRCRGNELLLGNARTPAVTWPIQTHHGYHLPSLDQWKRGQQIL